jgi:hypothetical protein
MRPFVSRGGGKVEYFRLRAIEYMRRTGKPVLYCTAEQNFVWTLNADGSICQEPCVPPPAPLRVWYDEAAEITPEAWNSLDPKDRRF